MRISQRDLAKHLGLSPMTISLALRNSPRLPFATRERVQMAANKLGYKPNPALAALNNHRRDRILKANNATLAFITNWQEEFGWRESYVNFFYQGAVARAAQCGYTLVPFWLKAYESPKRASDVLYNRGIRGLVLAPLENGPGEIKLDWTRFAAVAVGPTLLHPRLHRSLHDYDMGMRRILRELEARGYRRIALGISKRVDEITERRNSNTFLAETQRRYPHIEPLISDTIEETPKAAQAWLLKHKPDCIISLSSLFPETLHSYGWKVPQEIGHIHIHIEPNQAANQSGIEYNSPEIAAAAIDKLDSLLQRNELGLPERPLTLNLRGKWLEGNTLRTREDNSATNLLL